MEQKYGAELSDSALEGVAGGDQHCVDKQRELHLHARRDRSRRPGGRRFV